MIFRGRQANAWRSYFLFSNRSIAVNEDGCRYRQVLCANSFTSLAELSLHRAGKPALNYLVAEHRERVKATTRRKIFAIR